MSKVIGGLGIYMDGGGGSRRKTSDGVCTKCIVLDPLQKIAV